MPSPSAIAIRLQIEAALSSRIPSALTPATRIIRPISATGIPNVDELLEGGLPLGAITEIVGAQCSGRTALALSFIGCMTQTAKVCAWIDVSDTFHPESASAIGIDLTRLLWVRCGVSQPPNVQPSSQNDFALPDKYLVPSPIKKGLHGGGFGPHPRGEVKGLSDAVGNFLKPEMMTPRCAEPQRKVLHEREDDSGEGGSRSYWRIHVGRVYGGQPEWERNLEAGRLAGSEIERAVNEVVEKLKNEANAEIVGSLTAIEEKGSGVTIS